MMETFDLIVIGGGSGGIASANRAASYGARVALIEKQKLGGTCVNVGCVPKKVMWNAAHIVEMNHYASHYGFSETNHSTLDFKALREARDIYIRRLNGLYQTNLERNQVTIIEGEARFADRESIRVGDRILTAPHRLIAVGGRPSIPQNLGGAEHAIDSDTFFELQELPKRIAIIGSGYIAVEVAGVLRSLGSEVELFARTSTLLRTFDSEISSQLEKHMTAQGIRIHKNCLVNKISRQNNGQLALNCQERQEPFSDFDQVLLATGREPNTKSLNLAAAGVHCKDSGHIIVDAYQNTNIKGTYAVGDITGMVDLTPAAIAAGRQLAERLFNHKPDAHLNYDLIPTVVFSHPPIGTQGLTEEEAKAKHGADNVRCYRSTFSNMFYALAPEPRPQTFMKLVTLLPDENIIGMHGIGMGMDEIMQGFAVAIKMGATKKDFDNTLAIHPTAGEEFVTMR